ncbi:BnaC09g53170D [Brassica napus]|uniref:BnaC09g53170D protein n=1 Tax=Brassica napus TaxID=3708 RepID=A0A078JCU7_BRANA|nr:BnaC09g53170D [Brassica napus]
MMNYLIFMLVIAMCFSLNKGIVCNIDNYHLPQCRKGCLMNTLEFQNKLNPGSIFKVNCSSNKKEVEDLHEIKFNDKYQIFLKERGVGNIIVWRCLLRHGNKVENSQILWRAYRGAMRHRCGEKRSWISRLDGIYLEKNNKAKGFQHPWVVSKQ